MKPILNSGTITEEDWLLLQEVIEDRGCKNIVEVGSGFGSTVLLLSVVKNVISYENDKGWANKINKEIPGAQVKSYIYPEFGEAPDADLCLIDGPPGHLSEYRIHAMRWAKENYPIVAIHDMHRKQDRENAEVIFAGCDIIGETKMLRIYKNNLKSN